MPQFEPYAPEAIQAQLDRILESADFRSSESLRAFLRFVVEETLAGRTHEIKAYTVAVRAFNRNPDFDPQTDTIVRVQARRLRRALDHYFLTEGVDDPIRISIPRGTYIPLFIEYGSADAEGAAEVSPRNRAVVEDHLRLPDGPAVLVFPLQTGDSPSGQVYMVDGFAEQLVVNLTRFQEIRAIGPLLRTKFVDEPQDVQVLGERYAAQYILQGLWLARNGDVRITMKLVECETRRTVWAESFDVNGLAVDVLALQDQVAAQIAATVADPYGVIMHSRSQRAATGQRQNPDAADAILRYYHFFAVLTAEAWSAAFNSLEHAVEVAPDDAVVHSMLADMILAQYHLLGAGEEKLEQAEHLVRRALTLNPSCDHAHFMQANCYLHRHRHDLFIRKADQVIQNNPNRASIVGDLAVFLAIAGEWERGLACLDAAMKLSPHYPGWYHYAPFLFAYRRGDFATALAETLHFDTPGFYWDWLLRAAVLGQLRRTEEAASALAEMMHLLPYTDVDLRALIRRTVITAENADHLMVGLELAGL